MRCSAPPTCCCSAEGCCCSPAPSAQPTAPSTTGRRRCAGCCRRWQPWRWLRRWSGSSSPTRGARSTRAHADPLPAAALDEHAPGHRQAEQLVAFSILSRMLTTAVLVGPLVYLARRWRLPAGATTIVFATVSVPLFVLTAESPTAAQRSLDVSAVALLFAPLAAGVVGDVALRALDVGPARPWTVHGFAAGVTLALWVGHFVAMATSVGLAWPPELWGGAIGMSVLTALGVSALGQPRG